MPQASPILASFNGGEISEQAQGRVDLDRYLSSCRILENFIPTIPGAARKRSGTRFVSEVHDQTKLTRLVPFEFSRTQAYIIEFGDQVMRVYHNGGLVLETVTRTVSSITTGSPTSITTTASHEWNTGDRVTFSGVTGTDAALLNGKILTMTKTGATTFTVPVVTSGALASGTISRIFHCKTPYTSAELDGLMFSQSADVLYVTHAGHMPRKLLRHDHDEWTFTPYPGYDLERSVSVSDISNATPAVVTCSTVHGYVANDRIMITRARGMTEINGVQLIVKAVLSLTTFTVGNGENSAGTPTNYSTSSFREFVGTSSECVVQKIIREQWVPFANENTNTQNVAVCTVENEGELGFLCCTQNVFPFGTPVGTMIRLREVPASIHSEWKPASQMGGGTDDDRTGSLNTGDFGRYNDNVYELITKTGTKTGLTPPTHVTPGEQQTDHKWTWEYAHSGSGFFEVMGVSGANSGYLVYGRVRRRIPFSAVDTGALFDLCTSTAANPCQITTPSPHDYTTGDRVFLFAFTTADELNAKTYTITVTAPTRFTLDGTNATTFGAGANGYSVRVNNATHRWAFGAWSDDYGYPRSSVFYEGRLWLVGNDNQPQTIWGSVTGLYDSHEVTSNDTSAVQFAIDSQDQNVIEWITAQRQLHIGTAGGEFAAQGVNPDAAISQSNILRPLRMTEHGVRENVAPVVSEGAVLFAQRGGRKIREFLYDYQADTYRAMDLTALAEHVLDGQVRWMDFASEPDRVIWIVLETGGLVGLTYDRILEVAAFHRHTLGGADVVVESVAVIPHSDGDFDQVYFVVKRTINAGTKRYVEYIERPWRKGLAQEDAFFVDCGLTYDGAPTTTITGLDHLEGQTVQVLGDGVYQGTKTVASGSITITSASVVQVGLPMGGSATAGATLAPLRLEAGAADGTAQGKIKRIESIALRLHQTGAGLYYGSVNDTTKMDLLRMTEYQDPSGGAVSLLDGDTRELALQATHDQAGYIVLKHVYPLPATVVAIMPHVNTKDRI